MKWHGRPVMRNTIERVAHASTAGGHYRVGAGMLAAPDTDPDRIGSASS